MLISKKEKQDILRKMNDNEKCIPRPLRNLVRSIQPMSYNAEDRSLLNMINSELDKHISAATEAAIEKEAAATARQY